PIGTWKKKKEKRQKDWEDLGPCHRTDEETKTILDHFGLEFAEASYKDFSILSPIIFDCDHPDPSIRDIVDYWMTCARPITEFVLRVPPSDGNTNSADFVLADISEVGGEWDFVLSEDPPGVGPPPSG